MSEEYFPLKDEAWEDELFDEIQKGDKVCTRIHTDRSATARP